MCSSATRRDAESTSWERHGSRACRWQLPPRRIFGHHLLNLLGAAAEYGQHPAAGAKRGVWPLRCPPAAAREPARPDGSHGKAGSDRASPHTQWFRYQTQRTAQAAWGRPESGQDFTGKSGSVLLLLHGLTHGQRLDRQQAGHKTSCEFTYGLAGPEKH